MKSTELNFLEQKYLNLILGILGTQKVERDRKPFTVSFVYRHTHKILELYLFLFFLELLHDPLFDRIELRTVYIEPARKGLP